MKKILLAAVIALISVSAIAQTSARDLSEKNVISREKIKPNFFMEDFGLGFGLDYGGVPGIKFTFNPVRYMGVFGSVGYELITIGWNVGLVGRYVDLNNHNVVRPYLKVMYGINAGIKVNGASEYDKVYPGFSVGPGIELRWGRYRNNGMNIDLFVPIRCTEYYDMVNEIKNDPRIETFTEASVVGLSIGYHFCF